MKIYLKHNIFNINISCHGDSLQNLSLHKIAKKKFYYFIQLVHNLAFLI